MGSLAPRPSPEFTILEDRQMSTLTRVARSFVRSEEGATTAEYGIIIVVVAGIAIFVLAQLNGVLNTLYGKFGTKVNQVN
jgi:Flp pilus assembly pilin Flp